jgi:VCBS repeat protein
MVRLEGSAIARRSHELVARCGVRNDRIAWIVLVAAACQSGKEQPRQVEGAGTAPVPEAAGSAVATKLNASAPRAVPPLPDPLPGKRRDISAAVGKPTKLALADVDGDGKPELITVDAKQIRVIDHAGKELAHADVPGGIEVLAAFDVDGDHRAEILCGWGETREHRGTKAQITLHRLRDGALTSEVVAAPQTSRQDVVSIEKLGTNELALAYFTDKYMVAGVTAKLEGTVWTTSRSGDTAIRMATAWAHGDVDGDGKPDVVVGRVYGDAIGVDGDVFVLADGKRTPLPTTRGVQAIAVADLDGDGHAEVIAGDGWHQNYGQLARGLVTVIRDDHGTFRSELVEDTPGQYTIWQFVIADVDGDGTPEIITRGSHYVRVFHRSNGAWHGLTIAGVARDLAVADLDGTGPVIAIAGDPSVVVDLHGVRW